jgi:hypothetical protein
LTELIPEHFMRNEGHFMGIEGRFMEVEGHFIGIEGRFIGIEAKMMIGHFFIFLFRSHCHVY